MVLAGLAVIAWIYFTSEAHLRSFKAPPPFSLSIPTDSAALARGDHLVRTRGCRGCHGDDLGGELMWGTALAPDLVAYAQQESAATFEAALRHGIGRDGRAMYSMPSFNFMRLRDEDVADIIAYLRSLKSANRELPTAKLPWQLRLDLALGNDAAIPAFLDLVPPLRRADDPDPAIARGEYIAMTTCNECHGFGLRADVPWEGEAAPDLMIVMAYDETAFRRLMQQGIAIGDRELELMSDVARGRFVHFTDQELSDLYLFLRSMGADAATQDL